MRINIHFDNDQDRNPMVVVDGKISAGAEIQFSKASGLIVVDSAGHVLVGKKPEAAAADEVERVKAQVEEFLRREEAD